MAEEKQEGVGQEATEPTAPQNDAEAVEKQNPPGGPQVDDSGPLKRISGISLAPNAGEANEEPVPKKQLKRKPDQAPKPTPRSSGVLRQLGPDGQIVGEPAEEPPPAEPTTPAKEAALPDAPKESAPDSEPKPVSHGVTAPVRPSTLGEDSQKNAKAVIEPPATKSGLSVKRPDKKNWQKEEKSKATESGEPTKAPEPPAADGPPSSSGLSVKRPNKKNWQKETSDHSEAETVVDAPTTSEKDEPKKSSGKGLLILGVAAIVIVVLVIAGGVGAVVFKKNAELKKAQETDLVAAVKNKDTAAIEFVALVTPDRLNDTVDVQDEEGGDPRTYTLLGFACQQGQTEMAQFLIDKGAVPNKKDSQKNAPMHYAARSGHSGTVVMLLDAGADLETKGQSQCRPLHFAVDGGNLEVVELLLSRGASVTCLDDGEATPLHYAAGKGNVGIVKALLDAKADVKARDASGRVPLHVADKSTVLGCLIDAGTNPDIRDGAGRTALHYAAGGGNANAAEKLLSRGAKVNAKTRDGKTPLDVAHKTMVAFFKNRGGKSGKEE